METLTKALMRTFSGELIDLLDPHPSQIHIEDIAHHGGMLCRFNGATRRFYSVDEHAINVGRILNSLDGLLHDASESYITDLNGNLKKTVELAGYKKVEKRLEEVIQEKFKIRGLDEVGKKADLFMLNFEGQALIKDWHFQIPMIAPSGVAIECLSPIEAKLKFLEEFEKYFLNR